MPKEVFVKSLYIGFNEDGTPGEVQIQRVKRWTDLPEGAVIEDAYLPVERQGYSDLSPEQRKLVKSVLGATAAAEVEKHTQAKGRVRELEAQVADIQLAHDTLTSQTVEDQARARDLEEVLRDSDLRATLAEQHIQGLMLEAERRETEYNALMDELVLTRSMLEQSGTAQPQEPQEA